MTSIALHLALIGWGVISFSARSMEAPPPDSLAVDIISADQLSKLTAGIKTGAKDMPKPLVDKVGEARPVDDAVGKLTDKKEIVTSVAPEPPPKPVEKPVEKKPDPVRPVAETKPKDEPRPVEKKPDPPKIDPDAEALRSDEAKKPKPKQEAKATPPQPKQERVFDQAKIAALLDKRDPTRQSIVGAALNPAASLGTTTGRAATLSQSELDAMRARLSSLWNVQPGDEHPEELEVTVRIQLGHDRRLTAPPKIVAKGSSPRAQAVAEAAVRAVLQGQPYTMLRDETYDQWKYMDIEFDSTMIHS